MKITTVNIGEKLNKEQTEIISNIIHDVLADSKHKESLDFYTWSVQVDIIMEKANEQNQK